MKLKHAVVFLAGGTPDTATSRYWDESDEGMPWVSISDMSKTSLVIHAQKRLTPDGLLARSLSIGEPGTVLFAMYASVGAVATLGIRATWNQAILGLVPAGNRSDSRFVAYWLRHLASDLGALTRTSTQANLNADQVANLPFPNAHVEEQRRIADFLDDQVARIDNIIAARVKQSSNIDHLFSADVHSTVFVPGTETIPLGYISLVDHGRQRSPENDHGPYMVPYVRSANVTDGRIDTTDLKEMNFTPREQASYRLIGGDVLVTEASGSAHTIGASAQWTGDSTNTVCFQNHLLRLRPRPGIAIADYLYWWARASYRSGAMRIWATGANILNLGSEALRKMPAPAVTISEQARIVRRAQALESAHLGARGSISDQVGVLSELKRSLITAAVSGEFDVSSADGSQIPLERVGA